MQGGLSCITTHDLLHSQLHAGRSLLQQVQCQNTPSGVVCGELTECLKDTAEVSTDGTMVTLKNCLIPSGAPPVSFISVDEKCDGTGCVKTENVAYNAGIVKVTRSSDSAACSGKVCIHAHDGRYRQSTPNTVAPNVCVNSAKQRCALCSAEVNVRLSDNARPTR
jgi:hypothetical protein